jgi:hypothetical protein
MVDLGKLLPLLAITMVRLQAVGVAIPESAETFLIAAFVQSIKEGTVVLVEPIPEEDVA